MVICDVAEYLGVTKATASALIDKSETGLKELNQVKKVARENLSHLLENLPNEKLLKIVE
jgi:predicted transcriptional regulator